MIFYLELKDFETLLLASSKKMTKNAVIEKKKSQAIVSKLLLAL